MTRTIAKIAAAGVLFAAPIAFGAPAFAAAGFGDTPSVLPAPLPADPAPAPAPPEPAQHNYEYYNPNDYNDWWYNAGADGGGGGGGGGG
jgi:hypothetical protein